MAQNNNAPVVIFWIAFAMWIVGMSMFFGTDGWSIGSVFWVVGGLAVLGYLGSQIKS
jgi:hypothetical protein